MESLQNIANNVPMWLTRLDDFTGQIGQRQVELAALAKINAVPRSIKNRGSTESLRPKDDTEDHTIPLSTPIDNPTPIDSHPLENIAPRPQARAPRQPSGSFGDPKTPAALHQQSNQAIAAVEAKARAMVKRKMKTASLMSSEEPPKYRSRSMVIIYYDSYVQSFFEELVKFVSSSRNLLRKAKMAAKVAQIRKLAEMEMQDETPANSNPSDGPLLAADPATDGAEETLPPIRFMSAHRMGPVSKAIGTAARSYSRGIGLGTFDDKPDIYDDLDKGLEYVQSMCEHGAHQFLRDGTCNEEVKNIQRRLAETRDMAQKELQRLEREDPQALQPTPEETRKSRAYKPPNMRKMDTKDSFVGPLPTPSTPVSPAISIDLGAASPKEVHLEVDDNEAADDDLEIPKLVYRSTRAMRVRGVPVV